jgi:hypothetical protein
LAPTAQETRSRQIKPVNEGVDKTHRIVGPRHNHPPKPQLATPYVRLSDDCYTTIHLGDELAKDIKGATTEVNSFGRF